MESNLVAGSSVGEYQVVKKLAEGGMGEVFLVRNATEQGEDLFVLKTVLCGSQADAKDALKEAKALRGIQHPHVVTYVDVFPRDEAHKGVISVCTVMEYCSRGDLAAHLEILRTHHRTSVPLHQAIVTAWVAQLLMALVELHRMRIIHRDLKPQNVFLTSQGNLKIGDFGLATSMLRGKVTSRVGTPSYIAPEVLQHDGYGPAVDVWGVGCLALELMTLEFLSERAERDGMLAMQVHTKPVLAKHMPRQYGIDLRKCIASMLLVDYASRPSAAIALQRVEAAGRQIGDMGHSYNAYMLLQQQAAMTSGEGGWQPEDSTRKSLSHAQQLQQKQPKAAGGGEGSERTGSMSRRTPARIAESSMPKRLSAEHEESDPLPDGGGGGDFVSGILEGLKQVDVFGMWGGASAGGSESEHTKFTAPQPPASSAVRKAFEQALSEESLDGGVGDGMETVGGGVLRGGENVGGGVERAGLTGGSQRLEQLGGWGGERTGVSVSCAEKHDGVGGGRESESEGRGAGGAVGGGWVRINAGDGERVGGEKVGKIISKKDPVQVLEWESVSGPDAEAQPVKPSRREGSFRAEANTKHIGWETVQGTSVNTQELGPSGRGGAVGRAGGGGDVAGRSILREPKAHPRDSKSTLKLQEEEKKRQMWEAARNPGRAAGQWITNESGALEWVTNAKLAEIEREKEKDLEIKARLTAQHRPGQTFVGGAHAQSANPGVDLAARARNELASAPRRAVAQSVSERGKTEEEFNRQEQKGGGLLGKITGLGRKKKGEQEATQGTDRWGNPITTPANLPPAGSMRQPNQQQQGGAATLESSGSITRIVDHGPLKYRLSFEASKWEEARAACQHQLLQDYVADLPPSLRSDPSVLNSQVVRADDDQIDRQYRRMFGPPASKAV